MKENLAIFDLDGTLFNTEYVNYLAYQQALSEHGFDMEMNKAKEYNGMHYSNFLPLIVGEEPELIQQIFDRKKILYLDHLEKAKKNERLFDILNGLQNSYHIGLVTSCSRRNCMDILTHFGVSDLFERIVTEEDVQRVKPDPEGYLSVMKHFKMDAKHTLIFEDSLVGIQAAKSTGATVFIVDQF